MELYTYLQEFENRYQHSNERGNIIQEKNELIRRWIEQQIEERGRFNLNNPFGERTCKVCGGTGEIYKFFRDVKTITCNKCKGMGNIEKPCLVCQGSGRYIKEEPPLKINVKCKFCDGLGKSYITCPVCKGRGKVKRLVIAPKIKSTTTCPSCNGLGFYRERQVFNPCIDRDSEIADRLVQLIIPQKE